MKRLLAAGLLCACFATASHAADAPGNANSTNVAGMPDAAVKALLEKQTPGAWDCPAFEDALMLIHQRAGLAVVCAPGLAKVYDEQEHHFTGLHWGRGQMFPFIAPPGSSRQARAGADGKPETMPMEEFLREICADFRLSWKIDAAKRWIMLEPIWKKDDPRTAAELLAALTKEGVPGRQDDAGEWLGMFGALLGKDENFDTAVSVMQRACFGYLSEKPLVIGSIVNTKKEHYTFVLLCHPAPIFPGHDRVSYYWFKDNGTLADGGIFNSNERTSVVAASIVNAPGGKEGEPSGVRVIYQGSVPGFKGGFDTPVYYQLGENGLFKIPELKMENAPAGK